MVICHRLFKVTVTLTCDLVPRIIVSGAFEVGIPNLVCRFLLGLQSGAIHFGSFLGFSYLEHTSFLTIYFPRIDPIPLGAFVTLL